MAKVHIKSEKLTPFGGIFSIMEHFDALLSEMIDSTLDWHCKWFGYLTLRTFSSDTILRAIRELSQNNISYTSDSGKAYEFNTAKNVNELLVNSLLAIGGLEEGGPMTWTLTTSS